MYRNSYVLLKCKFRVNSRQRIRMKSTFSVRTEELYIYTHTYDICLHAIFKDKSKSKPISTLENRIRVVLNSIYSFVIHAFIVV